MAIQPSKNKMMSAPADEPVVTIRGGCGAPVPVEDVDPKELEKAEAEALTQGDKQERAAGEQE